MAQTTAEFLIEQGMQLGIEQGKTEGKAEGKAEGKQDGHSNSWSSDFKTCQKRSPAKSAISEHLDILLEQAIKLLKVSLIRGAPISDNVPETLSYRTR